MLTLGMKPGPAMGRLLVEIREKQLQDELKTAAQAREWVRSRAGPERVASRREPASHKSSRKRKKV